MSQIRSLDNLREFLAYDASTGWFTWLQSPKHGIAAGTPAAKTGYKGYLQVQWGRRIYKAHQLAWWFVYGELPNQHSYPDHINGIRSDNRIVNLRIVNHSQNQMNRRKAPGTSSKYKGVCFRPAAWQAGIKKNQKRVNLGSFATEEEAARAYDAAAREMFGEHALLNFPDESNAA